MENLKKILSLALPFVLLNCNINQVPGSFSQKSRQQRITKTRDNDELEEIEYNSENEIKDPMEIETEISDDYEINSNTTQFQFTNQPYIKTSIPTEELSLQVQKKPESKLDRINQILYYSKKLENSFLKYSSFSSRCMNHFNNFEKHVQEGEKLSKRFNEYQQESLRLNQETKQILDQFNLSMLQHNTNRLVNNLNLVVDRLQHELSGDSQQLSINQKRNDTEITSEQIFLSDDDIVNENQREKRRTFSLVT